MHVWQVFNINQSIVDILVVVSGVIDDGENIEQQWARHLLW